MTSWPEDPPLASSTRTATSWRCSTSTVQRGHALVIPRKHYVDIWDIPSDVLTKVVAVTKRVAQRMQEVWETEGVNTFSANGRPAGQDVYHFHMHVIPLGKGERTKFVSWWMGAMGKAERAELDRLADELRFR